MATPFIAFSDDFNREDGELQTDDGWGSFTGYEKPTITTNEIKSVKPTGSNHRRAYVVGSNTGRGQFCKVELTELPATGENNSTNIHMSDDGSRYELTIMAASYGLWKVAKDGSQGWMDAKYPVTYTTAPGQVWGLGSQVPGTGEGEGDAVYVTINDTILDAVIDTELTDGFCGVNQYLPQGGSGALDNWESGYARSGLTIVDVNGDNTITSNGGEIIITGSSLDVVDTDFVVIGDGNAANDTSLTVIEQDYGILRCDGIDIHDGKHSQASSVVVYVKEVAGGDDQETSIQVTLLSEVGNQHVVASSIETSPPGLLDTTTTTAVATDVYEGPNTVDGQVVTLRADGPHANINPAPNTGSTATSWHHSTANNTWEQIDETWNLLSGALAPSWTGIPNPPTSVVGVPYTYMIGALVAGQRPMTLTNVGGPLPYGLSLISGAGEEQQERIEGTPTSADSFTGIIIGADNGE